MDDQAVIVKYQASEASMRTGSTNSGSENDDEHAVKNNNELMENATETDSLL